MHVARGLAYFICAFTYCIVSQAVGGASEPDERLRRAELEMEIGNHAAAYHLASSSARTSSERRHRARAAQLLATICKRSGRMAEAVRHGEYYLRLVDPHNLSGIPKIETDRQEMATLLAQANGDLGRYEQANDWFAYALQIPNGSRMARPWWEAETRVRWARVARASGLTDQAEALYREAIDGAADVLRRIEQREVPARHRAKSTEVLVEACIATERFKEAIAALEALLANQRESQDGSQTLLRLADLLNQSGSPQQAAELLERALAEGNFSEKRPTAEQARLWEHLAIARQRQAQLQGEQSAALRAQARDALRKATTCFKTLCDSKGDRETPFVAAENLQAWYDLSVRTESWAQAAEAAKWLRALRQKTLLPDDPAIFLARRSLGIAYAKLNRFEEATEQLQAALAFWEHYRPTRLAELRDTRQNLAETARQQGKYDVAEHHLRKLLQILNTSKSDELSTLNLIECHLSLGNVLSAKVDYQAAIDEYRAAEATCQSAARDPRDGRIEPLHSLALLGRAAVYKTQLRFDDAIDTCLQALELSGGVTSNQRSAQVRILVTLASLHLSRYAWNAASTTSLDLASARSHIDRASQLCGDRVDLPAQEHCQLLHVAALTSFREAQSHFRPGGDRDRRTAAASCAKAVASWQLARNLAERNQLRALQARSASYLAEAQLLGSQLADDASGSAAQLLDVAYGNASMAIELLDALQAFPGMHYRALLTRAKVLRRQRERLEDARQASEATAKIEADLTAAVRIVEAPRSASLGTEGQRAEFFSQFVEAYELLVTCLVNQHRFDEAVAYSQISRNRTFAEQVAISPRDLEAELRDAGKEHLLGELQESIEKRDRLTEKVQQHANSRLSAEALQALEQQWARPLEAAQAECDRLAAEIRRSSRAFRNLLEGGLTLQDWKHARGQVVRPDGLLLVYHLGPTASELFIVTSGDVTCRELRVPEETAAELGFVPGPLTGDHALDLVTRYLSGPTLSRPRSAPQEEPIIVEPLSPRQAVHMADIIFPEDVRALIRKRQPEVVMVIPDGALHRLPLESLLVDDEPASYMLDDPRMPPIAYAPSVMVLAALQSRGQTGVPWPPAVLTVGNPSYRGGDLEPLVSSADECRNWSRLFAPDGTHNVRLLLEDSATERNVRDGAAGRRLVHFAVHGVVDPRHDSVFAASLALAPGSGAADDDGYLYLHEIYELPLADCELAVLSACQSNVGPTRKLEAGSTLTRAFLSAGAARVVSSLWLVDDESTSAMMEEFARLIAEALQRGQRPNYAQALQQARRHVRNDEEHEEWRHPHYWAPFVLIGPAK